MSAADTLETTKRTRKSTITAIGNPTTKARTRERIIAQVYSLASALAPRDTRKQILLLKSIETPTEFSPLTGTQELSPWLS